MKRTAKIIALLMAAMLALGLTACTGTNNDSNTPASTTPASTAPTESAAPVSTDPGIDYTGGLPDGVVCTEPITLTAFQWALDNQTTDFQNLWFFDELEKDTNVHIDFEVIKQSDYRTKLNLMFNSGEWPDILLRPDDTLDIEQYGVSQGILIPLDGYIEANMPNYSSRLGMNNVKESLLASDGKMYFIGNLTAQDINHEANWFINKTWLAAVGKEVPKTIGELTDVLKAFRDAKLGADGVTIPFSVGGDIFHQTQGLYTHFAMFGVPLQYFVYACIGADDKVVFPGDMPGFREACEWLNMCYTEGLLDKEFTQGDGPWGVKVNNDQVGFTTYLRLINTAWKSPETTENWVSIIPPSGNEGATCPRVLEIPTFGAALTKSNKHVPETLRWLDAQFETVRMLESVNGPMGDNSPIDPCLKINDAGKYEVVYVPDDNGLYKYVPVSQGQFFAPGDYYFDIFDLPPHRIERRQYSKDYETAGVVEKNSYMILQKLVKLTEEENDERGRLYEDIDTFMRESIAAFVTKGVTDASWQKFLSDARSVGVDQYVELYQKAYDVYLAAHQ